MVQRIFEVWFGQALYASVFLGDAVLMLEMLLLYALLAQHTTFADSLP